MQAYSSERPQLQRGDENDRQCDRKRWCVVRKPCEHEEHEDFDE
jgi:hypothetical protein